MASPTACCSVGRRRSSPSTSATASCTRSSARSPRGRRERLHIREVIGDPVDVVVARPVVHLADESPTCSSRREPGAPTSSCSSSRSSRPAGKKRRKGGASSPTQRSGSGRFPTSWTRAAAGATMIGWIDSPITGAQETRSSCVSDGTARRRPDLPVLHATASWQPSWASSWPTGSSSAATIRLMRYDAAALERDSAATATTRSPSALPS